jgi:hypothetical protein
MIHGRKQYFGLIVVALLGFASSRNFQQIVRNIFFFVKMFGLSNFSEPAHQMNKFASIQNVNDLLGN